MLDGVCSVVVQGPLPGGKQTINRGELYALIQAMSSSEGWLIYVTDSAYVVRGLARLTQGKFARTNKDLWRQVRDLSKALVLAVLRATCQLKKRWIRESL